MLGDPFYQKNKPDYAPDFIQTQMSEGINYIVCNNLETLTWLGNQLAFEFHIPFQTIKAKGPSEIVFDLDPPSRDYFHLAIKAALMMKEVFDGLKLLSFIKTSGNKGLQVYIPLPENTFSYDDTRKFTEFMAHYLITKEPDYFTIERLKKNRGNKLYVDYIQHAEGKTIISPYSARGNEDALVATPLFWEEVTEELSPLQFPLDSIMDRINKVGDPFQSYFSAKQNQPFHDILTFLTQAK
jgi:bifunctional non-homologous end joining protein LigD